MKRVLFIVLLLVAQDTVFAQESLNDIQPDDPAYENVHVKKIAGDERSTTFVIWVKQGVKSHYHADHTEQLVVLDGKGTMTIGDKNFEIKRGDFINIPKGAHHSVVVKSKKPLKVLSIQAPEFLGKDRIWVEDDPKKR